MRKFTEQEREKLKSLISSYIEVRDLSFGQNRSQSLKQGHQNSNALRELLNDNNIDPSWMGTIKKSSNEDKIISKLFKEHPELNSNADKIKEICLLYIKMKKTSLDVTSRKERARNSLLKKIANIDPMLSAFVLFKVNTLRARQKLEQSLVNETLDSLEQRYKEILKDFDL